MVGLNIGFSVLLCLLAARAFGRRKLSKLRANQAVMAADAELAPIAFEELGMGG